jgi:hypothetical protein
MDKAVDWEKDIEQKLELEVANHTSMIIEHEKARKKASEVLANFRAACKLPGCVQTSHTGMFACLTQTGCRVHNVMNSGPY